MILVLGRTDDVSTRHVAEWLTYLNKEYIVVNSDKNGGDFYDIKILSCDILQKKILISVNGEIINLLNISSIWNRRNGFSPRHLLADTHCDYQLLQEDKDGAYIKKIKNEEISFYLSYIHTSFAIKKIKELGYFQHNIVNKLEVLEYAFNLGLDIPETYVFSQKKDLIELLNKNKNVITKPIGQSGIYAFFDEINYYTYVERINMDFVNILPDIFFPSMFQLEIDKKYDIRSFFLENKYYSMAIFSQCFDSTKTDFRKPNLENTKIKCIPFKLPNDVERKIKKLMRKLNLNTGSVDIIVDKNDNYIFLEVNPVGQFAMTSIPCNYYIEKRIAKYL